MLPSISSEEKFEGMSYISTMSVGINNDNKNKLKIVRIVNLIQEKIMIQKC
jgi:hypothetical protein